MLDKVCAMNRLPKELQSMIASYLVPPVYRLVKGLEDTIHWEGLCLNPHPGMVPLVDAYFERCLTIQSYLDYTMLLHLNSNPAARPLLDKYGYFFLILMNSRYNTLPHIQVCNPSQQMIEEINNGTVHMKEVQPHVAKLVYAYPGIFQVDTSRTKAAIEQWMTQISEKMKTIGRCPRSTNFHAE